MLSSARHLLEGILQIFTEDWVLYKALMLARTSSIPYTKKANISEVRLL